MRVIGLTFAAILLATPALAGWQDVATPADQKRLSLLEESKSRGLQQAQGGSDMGVIHAVLDPQGGPAEGVEGAWRCRLIKLGGMTPSRVYSWFTCRISDRRGHLYFQKLNGTTRTAGYLYPEHDGKYVYLGAEYMSSEPVHAYSGSGASYGAVQTPDDEIGLLSGIGSGHARIELPYPVQESAFDVIELRR
ncbi:MAG TPA: DUF4893 domain-containing protein [Rhizomicrobium sp.]|jgi:hypothetical protein